MPVVNTLERKGFVLRGRDPRDRRRIPLSLTDSGRHILARVPVIAQEDALVSSLSQMGLEKQAQLTELLRELLGLMTQDQGLVERALAGAFPPFR